jgi:hypothetical protein
MFINQYLHPTHNFAIVRYDPKLIGETNVLEAPLSDNALGQGHKVTLVAYNHNQRPICLTTAVTDVTCITIPHNAVSEGSQNRLSFIMTMLILISACFDDRAHDSVVSTWIQSH